jgi:membrane protein implicated in regulation of membrane protease activity
VVASGLVWWIASGALLVVELTTGTFYLLMIALGCAAGGIAHLIGLPASAQFVLAALVALAAVTALRRSPYGRRQRRGARDATRDADVILDIGETLRVARWENGRARAMYRGAEWDVELAPGQSEQAEWYVIRQVRGNRLIVTARPDHAPSTT